MRDGWTLWARQNGKTTLVNEARMSTEGESMTYPTRDVDLNSWVDGLSFKPANTVEKQLGHEAARRLTAQLGVHLHALLPAGRDKSLVFTLLEDVLMRANRALALGAGPNPVSHWHEAALRDLISHWGLPDMPSDDRIAEYEAAQRGEETPAPNALLVERPPLVAEYDATVETGPATKVRVRTEKGTVVLGAHAYGEGVGVGMHDRAAVEEVASHLLGAANRAFRE